MKDEKEWEINNEWKIKNYKTKFAKIDKAKRLAILVAIFTYYGEKNLKDGTFFQLWKFSLEPQGPQGCGSKTALLSNRHFAIFKKFDTLFVLHLLDGL